MPDQPPPRRALSLKWRLVGGYTLVAVFTLSTASFLLHRGLEHKFLQEHTHSMADSITSIRRVIKEKNGDLHEAEEQIKQSAGEGQIEKYYCRLLHVEKGAVVSTPGAETLMPAASDFPPPVPEGEFLTKLTEATSLDGKPVWIGAATVERRNHRPLQLQIALDRGHAEAWLSDYRNNLIFMTAAASAATALIGWFIARRSLRPLREITSTAQRITASGLGEQIGNQPWPEELATLAGEFDRMLQRLRESFNRLSQFTADAAHEFRTPLNNLLGGTSLALSRPRSSEDYHGILEANLDEYHRLNHMMESLLFLARADNAQTLLKLEPVETAGILHEVEEFFSALAEDRGISIACRGSATIAADTTLLRMALTNLVSNALRHSPAGTMVTLTATSTAEGVTLSVQDEGEGIAAEHLDRLFDRFYRAEHSRTNHTENSGGSGLGLALVKTIMELHGGTASVTSTQGKGSTFVLHFPPFAEPAATRQASQVQVTPRPLIQPALTTAGVPGLLK